MVDLVDAPADLPLHADVADRARHDRAGLDRPPGRDLPDERVEDALLVGFHDLRLPDRFDSGHDSHLDGVTVTSTV